MSRYSARKIVVLSQRHAAEVLAFAAALARRTGLGTSEMAALEHLQQSEAGLTPTQLGRRLSLSSGSVTALVDRLEKAGRVERRPHPGDRRSSVVYLKPSGLEDALQHMRPLEVDLMSAAEGLTDEERAVVGGYFELLNGIFARHAQG